MSPIRALSARAVKCVHRWPRALLILGALVYVSVLVVWASANSDKTVDSLKASAAQAESAIPTKPLPSGGVTARRFQCVAWRATGKCRPNGPREPQNDKNCSNVISSGMSGYCEVEDIDTGERFQVMRRHCNSLKGNIRFRCSDAPAFANYRVEGHAAVQKALAPGFSLPHVADRGDAPQDGIVMVVYPKLLASAYATIRALREVLSCRLPIEIWFHVDEIGDDYASLAPLQQLAIVVGDVSFHPMYNPRAKSFLSKVFAIYNSHFDRHKLTGERDAKLEAAALKNTAVPPEEALGAQQPDGYPDPIIWTHLLSFRKDASHKMYTIDAYRAAPEFPQWQPCYGRRYVENQRLFELQEFANLSFSGIETDIRRFAMEAARLRHAQAIAWVGAHPSNTTRDELAAEHGSL
ncbi:hypothetical protein PRIC2_004565 [Phytophthora ramorum]